MPSTTIQNLGTITSPSKAGVMVDLPISPEAAANYISTLKASEEITDEKLGKQLAQESRDEPSIWFVNFPSKMAAENQQVLKHYQKSVLNYRCWASLIWWATVHKYEDRLPTEAARTSYCAKVARQHMEKTPWLAFSRKDDASKEIECATKDFHTELVSAVLQGFVTISPAIVSSLEAILTALRRSAQETKHEDSAKFLVLERYEYIPQSDDILSYVRLVSFSVDQESKKIERAKADESWIKCTIKFNEYEARFNHDTWLEVEKSVKEEQIQASKEFLEQQTVDCPPPP